MWVVLAVSILYEYDRKFIAYHKKSLSWKIHHCSLLQSSFKWPYYTKPHGNDMEIQKQQFTTLKWYHADILLPDYTHLLNTYVFIAKPLKRWAREKLYATVGAGMK